MTDTRTAAIPAQRDCTVAGIAMTYCPHPDHRAAGAPMPYVPLSAAVHCRHGDYCKTHPCCEETK